MNEGVPPGVYNVVHGFGGGSAGAFLTSHPQVDGVTFTGETGTGEIIMKAAARVSALYHWSWAARTLASYSPTPIWRKP
uniref:Aldehyde dehydrogenase domain-containing protein n=1 Tax=Ectopseudomonas oleovorans TaxID=301 RepID=A0A653BD77_ECTOL